MKPKSKLIWGIILVAVGILLLGETTGLFSAEDLFGALIPLAFILIGLWLILRRKTQDSAARFAAPPPPPPFYSQQAATPTSYTAEPKVEEQTDTKQDDSHSSRNYEQSRVAHSPKTDEPGKFKYSKTFGDMFIDCTGVNLQNVEVSAGFGDTEIRLHGGVLEDGLNRLIISSFIGDIRIVAPTGMAVFAHCSNFVGDVEVMGKRASGFGNSIDSQTVNYQESTKKLYVACNSFIGDIKVYGL